MFRCSPIAHRTCSSISTRGLQPTTSIAPLSRYVKFRKILQAQYIDDDTIQRVPLVKNRSNLEQEKPQEHGSGPCDEGPRVVLNGAAVRDRSSTKRHVASVSVALGRTYRRPSSITRIRIRKRKREQGPKDKGASPHEPPRGLTRRGTLCGHNKLKSRTQTVAPGIRLPRLSRSQENTTIQPSYSFPSPRQTPEARRSAYWLVNYQLLRWIDSDREDANKTLALHRERAKDFARGGSWQMNTRWRQIENSKGPTFALSILIGSLAYSARQALTFLGSIPNRPSLYFVHADSLFFLRQSRWEEIQPNAKLALRFWEQVERSRDATRWPKEPIRAWHLDLLLQNIPEEEQRRILSAYLVKYDELDDLRLLYIVDCYTRLKDIDAALSVLGRVSQPTLQQKGPVEPKSWAVAPRCMNLLELESVKKDGASHSFKVLPAILELGVTPDDLIYDLVVQKSTKFELPAVAWDIFRYARAQGAVIGPQTHLMLLKDSYLRRDASTLNEMLSIIQQSPELYQHPPINAYMVNIIRGICTYERGAGPAEALARMLAVYDKAYTRAALVRVGIIPDSKDNQGTSELPEPEALPLAFMVFSYIMVQKDEGVVTRLWRKLTSKMNQGDRELLAAARHPVFYDGFICFYSKDDRTISRALSVLRYMLASETCVPGDITWSMIIGMFLRHGKEESAEKVRQLMLRRGVPVTAKAWQQVLLSYPYTEVAHEVKKILRLGADFDVRDGTIVENDADTAPNTTESSVDVTQSQIERYSADDKPSPVWTVPEGLNSVFDLAKEKTQA